MLPDVTRGYPCDAFMDRMSHDCSLSHLYVDRRSVLWPVSCGHRLDDTVTSTASRLGLDVQDNARKARRKRPPEPSKPSFQYVKAFKEARVCATIAYHILQSIWSEDVWM